MAIYKVTIKYEDESTGMLYHDTATNKYYDFDEYVQLKNASELLPRLDSVCAWIESNGVTEIDIEEE